MNAMPRMSQWVCLTALVLSLAVYAEAQTEVRAVNTPPCPSGPVHYPGNRAPLTPSPLVKLPIGAIEPDGWLRNQLVLMADGMSGRLPEVSHWARLENNAWVQPDGSGECGWEEAPYWLKGFGDLGYVLKDERIIAETKRWIDGVIASQRPDGYFGPQANREQNDVWPNMVMLNILESYYEVTADARVLDFMTRYFRWELEQGDAIIPGSWQQIRAGDNLQSIYWLYNRTGEPFLLEAAKLVHRRAANWTEDIQSWHGVNICQGYREPAVYYQQSADPAHLDAAERNYQKVFGLFGQVPGGLFGADENCRPGYNDPRQGAETCSMVEIMHSFELLLAITGNPLFADRCEEVAFNSLPASMTPDLKGLHYLTAPNMIQLDAASKSPLLQNGGCMLAYSPDERYRCCQHNVAHGWPYFAEHLWMATGDNGLAATLYSACRVTAKVGPAGKSVTLIEETDYPFYETIRITVNAAESTEFPLYLRIPAWANEARIRINDQDCSGAIPPSQYAVLNRTWNNGDQIELTLPMQIRLRTWKDNHNSVSVDRGPLTYSLKIAERWERLDGPDAWPNWEVYPTTSWNYGLAIDPAMDPDTIKKTFRVWHNSVPVAPQPFTANDAPLELEVAAKKIVEWTPEQGLVGLLQDSPALSNEPEEQIILIPMGCARLRITAFPTVSNGPDAKPWKKQENPFTASQVFDSLQALNDGILPKNSCDHEIPRFTWWDHCGTTEWVQWQFTEPRKISGSEVYWFDDQPIGGQCRYPASWTVQWHDGAEWKPVTGASPFGTIKDAINSVTFDPVTTDALRIVVQLQPGFSSGLFEWRLKE